MPTMTDIEKLADKFAIEHDTLAGLIDELQAKIDDIRREYMPDMKEAVRKTIAAKSDLYYAIDDAPTLFKKPRTLVIAGIRIGYRKLKGKVIIEDEAATIKRIRKLLPEDQAELLINVKENVDKQSVSDLSVADLKRLGIQITGDYDDVLIKPTDSEVDKLVRKLLEDESVGEAA